MGFDFKLFQNLNLVNSSKVKLNWWKGKPKTKKVAYDQIMCDTYVFPEASHQPLKPKDREIGCKSSYREAGRDIALKL